MMRKFIALGKYTGGRTGNDYSHFGILRRSGLPYHLIQDGRQIISNRFALQLFREFWRDLGLKFGERLCKSWKMPLSDLSHFDEKSGVVPCETPWGRWWQTVDEVHIEVTLPEGCGSREIQVVCKPKHISCSVRGQEKFQGDFFGTVRADDVVWTVEDKKLLRIVLTKADYTEKEQYWTSLLLGVYEADPYTLHQMRQKLDLERFQIENPGFDFSGAKLSKSYDNMPVPGSQGNVEK